MSLDDKTKGYVDRNTGGQVNSLHEVTQLGYLSGQTKRIISRKLKYIFTKKTTPRLSGHIGLQNMKVGVKKRFG